MGAVAGVDVCSVCGSKHNESSGGLIAKVTFRRLPE